MFFLHLHKELMDQFCYNGTLRSSGWTTKGSRAVIHTKGKNVCGPFEIYEVNYARQIAYLKAMPGYGLFETEITCTSVCEIQDSDIRPVLVDTTSVTGSHIIDGILRNAFQDKNGTVKLSVPSAHRHLLNYIISELERLEIGYSVGMSYDTYIIIQDRNIVEMIFRHEPIGQYPIEYLLGYISMQTAVGRQYHNTGSKYNEHLLSVYIDEGLEHNLVYNTSLLLSKKSENKIFLCPCFGHMLPISKVIDDSNKEKTELDNEEFDARVNNDDAVNEIRHILAPMIIRKMFEYAKYRPSPLEHIDCDGIAAMKILTGVNTDSQLKIAIVPEGASYERMPDCDYYLFYSENGLSICPKYTEGERTIALPFPHNPYIQFDDVYSYNLHSYVKKLWNNE